MITSEIIEMKYIKNFDNIYIEKELSKNFNSVIRWSITEISDVIKVSVSYEI